MGRDVLMIAEVKYRCEVCNKVFEDINEAESCERVHPVVEEIEYLYETGWAYPEVVSIEFKDGSIYRYMSVKILKEKTERRKSS